MWKLVTILLKLVINYEISATNIFKLLIQILADFKYSSSFLLNSSENFK